MTTDQRRATMTAAQLRTAGRPDTCDSCGNFRTNHHPACPDLALERVVAAARHLSATDEMLEHHGGTCRSDPCGTCDVWSHRTAEAWASLRARIAELDVHVDADPVDNRVHCTPTEAAWCPIHGDCRCEPVDGRPGPGEDESCPLHAPSSDHGVADNEGDHP
jgi:hypothetical protein